jgi:hypothetical protein
LLYGRVRDRVRDEGRAKDKTSAMPRSISWSSAGMSSVETGRPASSCGVMSGRGKRGKRKVDLIRCGEFLLLLFIVTIEMKSCGPEPYRERE